MVAALHGDQPPTDLFCPLVLCFKSTLMVFNFQKHISIIKKNSFVDPTINTFSNVAPTENTSQFSLFQKLFKSQNRKQAQDYHFNFI